MTPAASAGGAAGKRVRAAPPAGARGGFSLLELVAVVAVIAVLAAIAIPLGSRAIAAAESARCVGNLRAIGAGLQLYVSEHRGRFPTIKPGKREASDPGETLDLVLRPYVDDPVAFACPADDGDHARLSGTSYFWNSALNGQNAFALNFFNVTEPGRIPVVTDKEKFHEATDHPVNFLYADGRATQELRLFTVGAETAAGHEGR